MRRRSTDEEPEPGRRRNGDPAPRGRRQGDPAPRGPRRQGDPAEPARRRQGDPSSPARRPQGDLVLAALERAQRQRPSGPGPVTLATLLAHLGIVRRSSGSRTVRARLETMIEEGAVERSLRHGVEVFALPPEAARRGRRRRERAAASLPESPQHRAWREARAIAGHELPRLATTLHAALRDALDALDSRVPLHSDAWLLTAERLREECRRLGSAIHCLHEWEEPDERSADVDERSEPWDGGLDPELRARLRWLRAGRRNVTLWRAR